jgi:hypothetical protein
MFIWPNGSVTGSVRVAELDAFTRALHAGEALDEFAEFLPADAGEYRAEAFPLPDPEPVDDADDQVDDAEAETEPEVEVEVEPEPVKRAPRSSRTKEQS